MCNRCDHLAARAKEWTIVAELEAMLIEAQAAEGLNIPGATRPLFDHELGAQVRFAELDEMQEEAVAEAEAQILILTGIIGAVVVREIFGNKAKATPAELAEALARFDQEQPARIREAIEQTAAKLETILAGVYADSSLAVLGEAQRQGVDVEPDPLNAPRGRYKAPAAAVASHPWQRTTTKLRDTLLNPAMAFAPEVEKTAVESTLEAVGTDGATDLARQTIHGAHGEGRIDTAGTLQPDEVFSSELLDGQTCDRCAEVDGKQYESLDDARQEYPFGPYKNCLGGMRCRGTLLFIFNDA